MDAGKRPNKLHLGVQMESRERVFRARYFSLLVAGTREEEEGERRGMVEPWPARRDRFCTRHEECNLPGFSPLPPPPTSPSPPPRTTIFHPLDRQLLPLLLRRRQRRRSLSTDSELLRNKILTIDDARSSARIRFNVRLSFFLPSFPPASREGICFILFRFILFYLAAPFVPLTLYSPFSSIRKGGGEERVANLFFHASFPWVWFPWKPGIYLCRRGGKGRRK